jgi:hypothetical protein
MYMIGSRISVAGSTPARNNIQIYYDHCHNIVYLKKYIILSYIWTGLDV